MAEEKFYLTKEGLEKLKKEQEELQKMKALQGNNEVPDILHSEEVNPEYLAFQQDMMFLESRIAELENVLKNAVLIKAPLKTEQDKIGLGATVQVEVDGRLDEFILVGSLEANPSVGKISNHSPVGKALIGRKVGDIALISSPIKINYKIKKISYDV